MRAIVQRVQKSVLKYPENGLQEIGKGLADPLGVGQEDNDEKQGNWQRKYPPAHLFG